MRSRIDPWLTEKRKLSVIVLVLRDAQEFLMLSGQQLSLSSMVCCFPRYAIGYGNSANFARVFP